MKMRLGVRGLKSSLGAQRLIHSTADGHTIYARQHAKKRGHSVDLTYRTEFVLLRRGC